MNKQELIEKVVKETGATKALAGKVLESAMGNIGKTLKKGDSITFVEHPQVGVRLLPAHRLAEEPADKGEREHGRRDHDDGEARPGGHGWGLLPFEPL